MTAVSDAEIKKSGSTIQMDVDNISQLNEAGSQSSGNPSNGSNISQNVVETETVDANEVRDGWGNSNKSFGNMVSLRGRGGHFNRGMCRGGASNLSGRMFESNWQTKNNTSSSNGSSQLELWVETKTDDSKAYYYHAITRDTTWSKPDGPNIKIITQTEVEEINKKQQQILQQQQQNQINMPILQSGVGGPTEEANAKDKMDNCQSGKVLSEVLTSQPPPVLHSQPPPTQQTLNQPPPNLAPSTMAPPSTQQPPPAMHQPPPYFSPGMHPSNFAQSPYGMPPPGYAGNFSGATTTSTPPWGMPWNQHIHPPVTQEKPAKNLIIKPGVIDPAVIARAAEWSEHRAPDGRPYYYHAGRGTSVWEKPQALRDMEAARMAAHGATPIPTTAPAPSMMSGMPPHLIPHLMQTSVSASNQFTDPTLAYAQAASAVTVTASNAKQMEPIKAVVVAEEKELKKNVEEKSKKEEEQKKTPQAKPVDKTRPISSTPISGTPWCVVWTGDARVFFYNPSSRTSVWERPDDLLDREDVDKAVSNPPEQLKNTVAPKTEKSVDTATNEKEVSSTVQTTINVKAETDEEFQDDDVNIIKIRSGSESSVEEVSERKPRLITKSTKKANASEAAAEAEVRAAKERAIVPLEARVKQFKEMLREKDVSAFSTWEKELHKIVFDPRYLLLTSKERKQVFEKYVKDRAEEERKEKRNKMRQKREDFRKLLEDANLHGKSSFSEFCQRYGKDERYKSIEKVRERESLFNEYILDVRRREKEEKQQKKEQIRKAFMEMLRERSSSMDRHTRWYDVKKKFESDSRYRAVENSVYREEYFQDFMRDEKRKYEREKEREREREKEREKERKRKGERKDKDRKRARSRSPERSHSERENKESRDKEKNCEKDKVEKKQKNDDYEEGEHSSRGEEEENSCDDREGEDEEVERLKKERERQMRAEQSIREREKEVQRTLAGHLRDRDKERELHKREEAVGHFNALLTDLVRNPDLTWKEVKRQLRKDHRWELVEILDRDTREKIFNEHIDNLMKKKREKFREMLDELSTLQLTSTWKDIKKLIKEDPRYLKYNNSEKCEREFRDYMVDKTISAKIDLKELLKECKLITHKSIDLVKENPHHLKEVQDILKMDKRYLVLEHLPEERTKIILDYLEELHKRGPPPPPTASEVTRRK